MSRFLAGAAVGIVATCLWVVYAAEGMLLP